MKPFWDDVVKVVVFVLGISLVIVLLKNPGGTAQVLVAGAKSGAGLLQAVQGNDPSATLRA